jgi:hypothetical protein
MFMFEIRGPGFKGLRVMVCENLVCAVNDGGLDLNGFPDLE